MSDNNTKKRTPDFIAHTVKSQGGNAGPKYTRIGVGFTLKNGGISVLYDGIPLSGQIILLDSGSDEKPATISYGSPTRKPSFEVSMVRNGSGDNSFWTTIGAAYRQEGYISILVDVVPINGKLILTLPREEHA